MKLTKIHRVRKLKQSDWMKKYIDFNNKKRINAANDFEKDFFKLMTNSVYEKTMENLRKRINVRLVNNAENVFKNTSKLTYITHKIFGKDYAAIHEIKPILVLNKPIYIGFTVLDLVLLMKENQKMFMKNFLGVKICLTLVTIQKIQSFLMRLIKKLLAK